MKSFLQGKKNLDASALRAPTPAAPPATPRCTTPRAPLSVVTPGASNAHVEVVKEGSKVSRIIVTCVCGERVEIDCLYSAGS